MIKNRLIIEEICNYYFQNNIKCLTKNFTYSTFIYVLAYSYTEKASFYNFGGGRV